ncbi:MAG: hypothetical protein MK066_07120 [Crocinitomicaceae bacterium]|nr:hypothetical protein [Crocinitomicaceae bacterium]
MAGGKETPRQKMIGMMYLVLTALLALNVSKSILDAFVSIEENIQKANLTELFQGNERRSQLIEIASDQTNPAKAKKAELMKKVIDGIDKKTAEQIVFIDNLKLEILEACGEDIATVNGEESILVERYDGKKAPLKPIRMNLSNVNAKDKYDEPMHIMIGDDIKRPKGNGIKLWNSILEYRKELTETVASSQMLGGDKPKMSQNYFFKAPSINKFDSQKDLDSQLKKSIASSKVHPSDVSMIMEIYKSLTKEEYSTVNDVEGVHWIGKTFDHAPSVAAIASLSSLQKDILSARAKAIAQIRKRVGGTDYSFNKIFALATGPEIVNQGDEFDLKVMMVAYDSDNQPEVSLNGDLVDNVYDGQANIKLTAQGTSMELKGTVTVQNKAGMKKTLPWEKTVQVMKPSGSIELPEMNVLYRGYKNRVIATVSGFPETILTPTGATVQRNGGEYIVNPGSGRTATLAISGKTSDGRVVQLKRVQYKVSRLPKPSLYIGASTDGDRMPPSDLIQGKYDERIPLNASFRLVSWQCSIQGAQGRMPSGSGTSIASARNLIRAARTNQLITFTARVQGPDGIIQTISSTFRK